MNLPGYTIHRELGFEPEKMNFKGHSLNLSHLDAYKEVNIRFPEKHGH